MLLIGFLYRKLKVMNEYNELLFSLKKEMRRKLKIMNECNELLFSLKKEMRTSNFVPRCTWVPLGMGLNLFQLPNCSHFAVVARNSLWD